MRFRSAAMISGAVLAFGAAAVAVAQPPAETRASNNADTGLPSEPDARAGNDDERGSTT